MTSFPPDDLKGNPRWAVRNSGVLILNFVSSIGPIVMTFLCYHFCVLSHHFVKANICNENNHRFSRRAPQARFDSLNL